MIFYRRSNTSGAASSQVTGSFASSDKFKTYRKLVLFDLSVGGHHPAYIRHLIKYWYEQEIPGQLDIIVLPKFIEQHSDVVDIALSSTRSYINFVAITSEEAAVLKSRNSGFNRASRAFQEWHLLNKYAASLKATHCLIMYFDTCELPLVLGARLPCPFSSIYFRPTFHYCDFADYAPSGKERLQQWREKFSMSRILRHPQLKNLFCLDPFVVKHINQSHTKVKAVHLPDPVQVCNIPESQSETLKKTLGIERDRQVFFLFGSLTDRRKGIQKLLEAVSLLSPTLCQKLCLLFVGEADPVERKPLEYQIADVCQSQPVQIISRYEFIPEQDVHLYFQLADAVMAPYQRHVGMSGILLLAAAAQKPVLSSNYGLMGEVVKSYGLGLTVDSTLPSEIAKGLTQFLSESPYKLCDRTKMQAFVEQNSVEKFAHTIFQYL